MIRVAVAIAPEVRQLLEEDPTQLGEFIDEIHDEDLADLLELLGQDEAVKLLGAVPPEQAAKIFQRLDEAHQEQLVQQIGTEKVAPIVIEMAADDRADLVSALPDDVGESLLENIERVDPEAAADVELLTKWPDDCAGGLMTTDYVACLTERDRGGRHREDPPRRDGGRDRLLRVHRGQATGSTASRRCATSCSPTPRRRSRT
jgi:magnesium transporter